MKASVSMFIRCLCLLALFGAAERSVGSQPASAWRTATPESQGIDSAALADAIEGARKRGVNIHSFLLVRNGAIVAEAVFHPYDGRTPHDIASITKPITTTLVGLAISQGKIESTRASMLSVFSSEAVANVANVDDRKRRVTIDHLLTMSSGIGCKAQAGEPTLWEMLSASNNVRFMLDLPMLAEPGSGYVYCSGGMHLLSGAISQKTGMSAENYARRHLFAPLGIRTWIWPRDAQNVSHGFGNLHLLPRDMARLGQLFLDRGKWGGRQLVPAEWVAEATRSHIRTGGPGTSDYGYGWRVPPAGGPVGFEAGGRGGQLISVLPSKNAVVVLTGSGLNTGEWMKLILPAFRSDGALAENPASLARLRAAIAEAARPPAPQPVAALPALAREISGRVFELEPNWLGLRSIALVFRADAATATARLQFGAALKQFQFGASASVLGARVADEVRPVGLDGRLRISGNGMLGLPVGLKGAWEDDRTFVLEYDEIANTNAHRLRLQFDGDRVRVQARERTGLFNESYGGVARRN